VPDSNPAEFTVMTMPQRFATIEDPHAGMDQAIGSLEKLLELAAEDESTGLGDAPWPPHFRKTKDESTRVAPSRSKSTKTSAAPASKRVLTKKAAKQPGKHTASRTNPKDLQ
jgi:hypothetical protein